MQNNNYNKKPTLDEKAYKAIFENYPVPLCYEDISELNVYIDTLKKSGITDIRGYLEKNPEEIKRCASMIKILDINNAGFFIYRTDNKDVALTKPTNIFKEGGMHVIKESIISLFEGKNYLENEYSLENGENITYFKFYGAKVTPDTVIITILDITREKQFYKALIEKEAQLARSYEKLARSNEELRQISYIAAHDLQEPLRKITSFGDLLNKSCYNLLDDEGKNYVNKMTNAAIRERKLLDMLLKYYGITLSAQSISSVCIRKIVEESLVEMQVKIEEKMADITIGKLPTIKADLEQMKQLFTNLISNSLKFCKKDVSPKIEIESKLFCDSGLVEITVKDNGVGFDEKYLPKIFKPFQRLQHYEEYEGSGMGLAICEKIASLHNGKLTAKSNVDKGSIFTITLPIEHESL